MKGLHEHLYQGAAICKVLHVSPVCYSNWIRRGHIRPLDTLLTLEDIIFMSVMQEGGTIVPLTVLCAAVRDLLRNRIKLVMAGTQTPEQRTWFQRINNEWSYGTGTAEPDKQYGVVSMPTDRLIAKAIISTAGLEINDDLRENLHAHRALTGEQTQ